jgi:beta-fructofuranosidase
MWAWVFDQRGKEAQEASGWSGELSLPRVLWLGDDGALRMRPAEELDRLRYNPRTLADLSIADGADLALPDVRGDSLELNVELLPGAATQCGVKVCCSPDGAEETRIVYDAAAQALQVDTRRSSTGEGPKVVESAPLALAPGEPLRLRVYVDRSFVEVFANDRQAVARRIYPARPDSLGVALFARGGAAQASRIQAYEMMPANPY